MTFKFEKLEVWELALQYVDLIYDIAGQLPRSEEYNLKTQIVRAVTSIALNIAEGSTSQSDPEQSRFVGMALRSCVETIACLHLIRRRKYVAEELYDGAYAFAESSSPSSRPSGDPLSSGRLRSAVGSPEADGRPRSVVLGQELSGGRRSAANGPLAISGQPSPVGGPAAGGGLPSSVGGPDGGVGPRVLID